MYDGVVKGDRWPSSVASNELDYLILWELFGVSFRVIYYLPPTWHCLTVHQLGRMSERLGGNKGDTHVDPVSLTEGRGELCGCSLQRQAEQIRATSNITPQLPARR